MEVILYEDDAVSGLFPITLTRPAYDIRTGGRTLLEAVRETFPKASISQITRPLVAPATLVPEFSAKGQDGFLFLNARLAPALSTLGDIVKILKRSDESFEIAISGTVVGFFTTIFEGVVHDFSHILSRAPGSITHELSGKLLAHPEDIVFFNRDSLKENLDILTKKVRAKKKGLYLGRDVKLPKECVVDTTHGPVFIGDHTVIHSFTVLKGPLFIGESSIIKEFSSLEGSSIGPVCRIGGEVIGTVIDGYSNKQHYGTAEECYIGRWVNVGAGTSFSDLKNTYSNISIQGRDSGAQFLGPILGDFSKTAINTSIFPGKVVGVAAHVYDIVTEDVPAFTSHVRAGVLYELPVSLADRGQRAMAMRRGVHFTEEDSQMLLDIFTLTAQERAAKGALLDKISFK